MKKPIISIIIPVYYGSVGIIKIPLESIIKQTCSKDSYEIILVDNTGPQTEYIKKIANKYHAKVINISGKPSQACVQVNTGVKKARGMYVMILDHDIRLSPTLIENFLLTIKSNENIDAFYVPYKIISRGKLLMRIRNFEETFYLHSVISAPRIIKRSVFLRSEYGYDPLLNSGPADWDLTIQLKLMNIRFGYLKDYFYHHEENMSLWRLVTKKTIYAGGGEIYKNKWKKKNKKIYDLIVKKQFSPFYRLFWIFIDDGKWPVLISNFHLYIGYLILKITMSIIYLISILVKRA